MSIVWRLLPWALKMVFDVAKCPYEALLMTFRSWTPTAKQKATEWRRRVMESQVITLDYGTQVWWAFYLLAHATLITGWLLPPLALVWIVTQLF